jgi:hypothetical protein
MSWSRLGGWLVGAASLFLSGCMSPPTLPKGDLQVPTYQQTGAAKCTLAKSTSAPLVVDWSNVDRARLEAMSRSGVVIAAYAGCELKIIPTCSLPDTAYRYVGTTRKHDEDHIRNADDLYAKLSRSEPLPSRRALARRLPVRPRRSEEAPAVRVNRSETFSPKMDPTKRAPKRRKRTSRHPRDAEL